MPEQNWHLLYIVLNLEGVLAAMGLAADLVAFHILGARVYIYCARKRFLMFLAPTIRNGRRVRRLCSRFALSFFE